MVFYVTTRINADMMVVVGDRLCTVTGPLPQDRLDSAPPSDNRNIAPSARDYGSFPRLYILRSAWRVVNSTERISEPAE
jgi:hypothetical protein